MPEPLYSQVPWHFCQQGQKDLNPRHLVLETNVLPTELYPYIWILYHNIFKTSYRSPWNSLLWSSPRTISTSQLHALLHFHLRPIYLILSKGPYLLLMGYLILEGASRLDAFSVYPFRTWLPGYAIGMTTGAPAVRPARSSRTKASSPQISCARAG